MRTQWMVLSALAAMFSSAAQAAPTAAVLLLDGEDGVTVLDAFSMSAETIEALDLPVIAPPGSPAAASTVALSVKSVEQWTQVLGILQETGQIPLDCSWQQLDGQGRTSDQNATLSDGVYLFQLDAGGSTPQLQVSLYGDALTVE